MSDRQKRTEARYRTVEFSAVAEKHDEGWQGLFTLANGLPDRPGGEPQETPEDAVAEALAAAVHMIRLIFDEAGETDNVEIRDPDSYVLNRVAGLLDLPT